MEDTSHHFRDDNAMVFANWPSSSQTSSQL